MPMTPADKARMRLYTAASNYAAATGYDDTMAAAQELEDAAEAWAEVVQNDAGGE